MQNSVLIADRITSTAKKRGFSVSQLLKDCELGKNTIGQVRNGTNPSAETITKIAEYLDVSVDYLLGKEPTISNSIVNSPINGDNSNIYNSTISKDEKELLDIYNSLSIFQKGKLFSFLEELKSGE